MAERNAVLTRGSPCISADHLRGSGDNPPIGSQPSLNFRRKSKVRRGFGESHGAVRIEERLDTRNRAGQGSNATTGDAARLSGLLRELEQMIQQCPTRDAFNAVRAEAMRHEMRRIAESLVKWLNEKVAA
jgi:hypothetical protein